MRYLAILLILAATAARSLASPIITGEQALKLPIYTPQPQYPLEARARHITGTGTFLLHIPIRTGVVRTVDVQHTTASAMLDSVAVIALKQWRFKPDALPSIEQMHLHRKYAYPTQESLIRVPVHFVMSHKT
jgi:TonB family protein